MTKTHSQTRTLACQGQGVGAAVAGVDAPNGTQGNQARADDETRHKDVLIRLSVWLADVSVDRALSESNRDPSVQDQRNRRGAAVLPIMSTRGG